MKLKIRFLVILLGFALVLIAVTVVIAQLVFVSYANRVDENLLRETLARGMRYMDKELEDLLAMTGDWASWDDTYAYVNDLNEEYAEANLVEGTFVTLGIDLIAYIDSEGHVVDVQAYDRDSGEEAPSYPGLMNPLTNWAPTVCDSFEKRKASGFLFDGLDYFAVASAPILTSEDEGPCRGMLVMARRIGHREKRSFQDIVHPSTCLLPWDGVTAANGGAIMRFSDRHQIAGRVLLPGPYGLGPVVMQIRIPRQALAESMVNTLYLAGWLVLCSFAITIFVFLLLDVWVVRGLTKSIELIDAGVRAVERNADGSEYVRSWRKDELGDLTSSINSMLLTLRLAKEQLRSSEALYRGLVEAIPDGIVSLTSDGRIRSANRNFLSLISSQDKDEVLGRVLSSVWRCELAKRIEEKVEELSAGESAGFHDVPWEAGRERWFDAAIVRVGEEGSEQEFVLVVLIDTTERVIAEREAEARREEEVHTQRLASLGTLVAGVAHEVNNPNAVIGLNMNVLRRMLDRLWASIRGGGFENEGETIRDDPVELKNETDELLKETLDASARIATLVDSLKNFARSSSGEMAERVDLNEVLLRVCAWVRHDFERESCCLRKQLCPDRITVKGNEQQLEQVFLNLLQNACAAGEGSDARVSLRSEYTPDGLVSIIVEDTGRGIPREDISRVFDPFFTTSRGEGGTGLGLSISLAIVNAHGGMIQVESHVGVGTIVSVRLPATKEMNDAQ